MLQVVQDTFASSNFDSLCLVFFNDGIYSEKTYKRGEKLVLPRIELGGTSFEDVFQYADDKKCKALLMLTDGIASIPIEPKSKVVWLLYDTHLQSMPFGKVVKL